MIEKKLRDGSVAYYWNPLPRDRRKGFTLHSEALGNDYATACERANLLNAHLMDWRAGREATKDLDTQPGHGTVDWLVERYLRSDPWNEDVSERSRPEYRRAFKLVTDHRTKSGNRVGEYKLSAFTALAVDKLYKALKDGPRGPRLRQANVCVLRMAYAWDVVRRLHPSVVPAENPFVGVSLKHGRSTTRAATREEAYALHRALMAANEPHLAVVPLVCFEWHQRPENVVAGHFKWSDWRPGGLPYVRVVHHKTNAIVDMQLGDAEGPFFPELMSYLDRLEHLGLEVVLRRPQRRKPGDAALVGLKFTQRDARKRVRRAATAAGLPTDLTLAACRHGGLTELGDAGVTEQEGMAASGHSTPEAHRGYVKKTAPQRLNALRKRRRLRTAGGTSSVQESE